jgi:hypothetical protein
MNQDMYFKRLVTAYLKAALRALAPEIVAAFGMPPVVKVLGQEAPPGATKERAILDVALLCCWPDRPPVVVLIEHFSRARDVDRERVLRYTADLHQKHREALLVLPVVVVTDQSNAKVSVRFKTEINGLPILDLFLRLVRIDEAFVAKWLGVKNRVTASLCLLGPLPKRFKNRLEAVVFAIRVALASPGPKKDWTWLLPLMEIWGKLDPDERRELRKILMKDPKMTSVVDMFLAEGEARGIAKGEARGIAKGEARGIAKGEAKGKAEGAALAVLKLVEKGTLTVQQAKKELVDLKKAGLLNSATHKSALQQLKEMQ